MGDARLQLVPPVKPTGKGKKPAAAPPVLSQDFKKQVSRLFKTETSTGWPEGPFWADASILYPNEYQKIARPQGHTPEGIEQMRDSLDRLGQLQDALGRPHKTIPGAIELAFAHGRLEGVKAGGNAGSPDLPPAERAKLAGKLRIVVRNFTDEEMLELLSAENNIRTDTDPISSARLYLKLYEIASAGGQPATWDDVARTYKLSYRQVRRYVSLLELPRVPRRAIQKGIISMAVAPALHSLLDEQQPGRWTPNMKTLYRAVLREKLSGPKAKERAEALAGAVQGTLDLAGPAASGESGSGAAPGLELVPGGAAPAQLGSGTGAAPAGGGRSRAKSDVATMDNLPAVFL